MRKLIVSCLCINLVLLAGCSWLHPYQPDVQQGNVLSQSMIERIKPGMSKEQVEAILGESIVANAFDSNHWAYVYTLQHDGGSILRKNLDIYFKNNHVSNIAWSEGKVS